MLTNKLLFDYAKEAIHHKLNKYSHLPFLLNDEGEMVNILNFKIWKQRKNIQPATYKQYIQRAARNTVVNYIRNSITRIQKENRVPFITKLKTQDHIEQIEYFPDFPEEKETKINFDAFYTQLSELEIQICEYFKDGLNQSKISDLIDLEVKAKKRKISKIKLKIKEKLREFINTY